jgi:hypothetical protein
VHSKQNKVFCTIRDGPKGCSWLLGLKKGTVQAPSLTPSFKAVDTYLVIRIVHFTVYSVELSIMCEGFQQWPKNRAVLDDIIFVCHAFEEVKFRIGMTILFCFSEVLIPRRLYSLIRPIKCFTRFLFGPTSVGGLMQSGIDSLKF